MSVWWPGISQDIKQVIKSCDFCAKYQPTQRKEPLITTPLPQGPWLRVGADLCTLKGQNYLVMRDYYSRYLEIIHLKSTTAPAIIVKMKNIFARWGIPQELVSDNGPQFSAREFQDFASSYGFVHITVSPHLPQANGMTESAVKPAKKILRQKDPWLALMIYRDTPHAATGFSPAELMMGRHLRTNLPCLPAHLRPKWPDEELVRNNDNAAKERYAYYYNKRHGAQPLSELRPGVQVHVKHDDEKHWNVKGTVKNVAGTPRSYLVETETGTLRRNRRHLRPAEDCGSQPGIPPDVEQSPKKCSSPVVDAPNSQVDSPQVPQHKVVSSSPKTPVPQRRSSRTIKPRSRLLEEI